MKEGYKGPPSYLPKDGHDDNSHDDHPSIPSLDEKSGGNHDDHSLTPLRNEKRGGGLYRHEIEFDPLLLEKFEATLLLPWISVVSGSGSKKPFKNSHHSINPN